MKKKSFWGNLQSKMSGDLKEVREAGEKQDWVKSQFIELSRLGNNPIVMQMGN